MLPGDPQSQRKVGAGGDHNRRRASRLHPRPPRVYPSLFKPVGAGDGLAPVQERVQGAVRRATVQAVQAHRIQAVGAHGVESPWQAYPRPTPSLCGQVDQDSLPSSRERGLHWLQIARL